MTEILLSAGLVTRTGYASAKNSALRFFVDRVPATLSLLSSSRRRSRVRERNHGRDTAKHPHFTDDISPTRALHLMREEQRSLDSGSG